ncbi:hypothetical protein HBA92_18320 [Ochrobactrum sp. MR28]|nr:hypothetical protein [Ochrobactrum sp. MR28]MBX8817774.1 hypothetical protein [Ochrobactrum sp. MR31]
MQHLATALAIAVSYISHRSDDQTSDDNIAALESVISELQAATDEERKVLISAFTILGNTEDLDGLGLNML